MVTLGRLKGRFIPQQIQPSLCYRRKKQLMFSTDVSKVLTETQWGLNRTCWTGSSPLTRARNHICHVDGYLRSVLASPEGFGAVKINPDATTRPSYHENRLPLELWNLPWREDGVATLTLLHDSLIYPPVLHIKTKRNVKYLPFHLSPTVASYASCLETAKQMLTLAAMPCGISFLAGGNFPAKFLE